LISSVFYKYRSFFFELKKVLITSLISTVFYKYRSFFFELKKVLITSYSKGGLY
jgi:hypothetical protein